MKRRNFFAMLFCLPVASVKAVTSPRLSTYEAHRLLAEHQLWGMQAMKACQRIDIKGTMLIVNGQQELLEQVKHFESTIRKILEAQKRERESDEVRRSKQPVWNPQL